MKKSALALAATVLLLAACDSSTSTGSNGVDGAGNKYGSGSGTLGTDAQGNSIGDRVFFATDSSVVDSEGQSVLDRQAAYLKSNTSMNVTVEGHADERGTREYNIALGERRATAAKSYLVGQGIAASRLSTISYGKERPAQAGNDEGSWSQNRRAVTVISN